MPLPDYVPNRVWQDYPSTATLLHAADLNNIELGLQDASTSAHAALNQTGGPSIVAPAPSGGDDTAVLQPLLTQAQNTGGTLILRPGLYQANLLSSASSTQAGHPRILGQGKNYTTLQGFTNTSPVVRFKGGAGKFSGGYLADLSIASPGGTGLQLADVGGVRWNRIAFTGPLAIGVEFWNESTGGFTEFNHGDAEFASAVVLAVHYRRTGGNESFHGTGFTHGTVFNHTTGATSPRIIIDQGCFPYNAPLTAAFQLSSTVPAIRHLNTASARNAHFFGHITVENFVANARLVDEATTPVQYSGNYTVLGSTGFDQGGLRLNDIVFYQDTGFTALHKTLKVSVPASSTSPGDLGWWAADTSFIYFVVGQDVWRRIPAQTF